MAFNGSGSFSLASGNPVVTGTTISSTWANNTLSDIATGLSTVICKDGQTTVTANLPMAGFRHTGVGNSTTRVAATYASAADVQDGTLVALTSPSGTNTITATAAISMTAYAAGQSFRLIPANTNTGAATLNINSIGAKNIFANGAALVGNELVASVPVNLAYDGTQFNILGPNTQVNGSPTWIAAGGTADAITATYAPAIVVLIDGMTLHFRAAAANATTTPTFAPNGLTAHTITKKGGTALLPGDIPGNLSECIVRYNLANTRWELLNPYYTVGMIQRTYAEYTSNADLTTAIPLDNTIPQNTEGTEIITQAITPKYASSTIRVTFQGWGTVNGAGALIAALFVDTTANALTASATTTPSGNELEPVVLMYEEASASTTARTYKIRVGPNGGTARMNGNTAGRFFGGVSRSTLIVEEVV